MTDVRVTVEVVVLTLADAGAGAAPRILCCTPAPGLGSGSHQVLPGGVLGPAEDLEEAATRVMAGVGLRVPRHLEQLASFGAPSRVPGARTVSVTYLALVPSPFPAPAGGGWVDPADTAASLAWDHAEIVAAGVQRIRSKLSYSNIAFALLPDAFSMSELQEVYEAVLGTTLDRRNFRKKVLSLGLLRDTGEQRRGSHRPATLYAFTSADLVLLDHVIASA